MSYNDEEWELVNQWDDHDVSNLEVDEELEAWLDANEESSKGLCPPSIFLKEI